MKLIIIIGGIIILLQSVMLGIIGYILIESHKYLSNQQDEIQSSIYEIKQSLQEWEIIPND